MYKVDLASFNSIITSGDPCLSPGADNFPLHGMKSSSSVNSLNSQLKAAFSSPGAFDLPSISQNTLKTRVSVSLQESQLKLNSFVKSPVIDLINLNENARMVWNSLGVSNQCSWAQLSHALLQYFKTFASFERLLESQDLKFLLAKLNPNNNNDLEASRIMISLEQFEKFWPWFEQICTMISFILPLWVARTCNPDTPNNTTYLIHGFISKSKVIELLASVINVDGTFILRFSESRLGCLAVSYVDSGKFVHSLIEWFPDGFVVEIENKKKVKYPDLTELILKCKMFSNLFPNVNKNNAFTLVFADSSPD